MQYSTYGLKRIREQTKPHHGPAYCTDSQQTSTKTMESVASKSHPNSDPTGSWTSQRERPIRWRPKRSSNRCRQNSKSNLICICVPNPKTKPICILRSSHLGVQKRREPENRCFKVDVLWTLTWCAKTIVCPARVQLWYKWAVNSHNKLSMEIRKISTSANSSITFV